MHAIAASGISRSFGEQRVLQRVSFTVQEGTCTGFLGANGSGKTTLLRVLLGLERCEEGHFFMLGHRFDSSRARGRIPVPVASRIGYVPQQPSFDEHVNAWETLFFHGKLHGLPRPSIKESAITILRALGLLPHADKKVGEYSGGMKKRLAIARALLHSPVLLFLDEPAANLDPRSKYDVWDILLALKARGVTMVLATNDMVEAQLLGDEVHFLEDGRFVTSGEPRALVNALDASIVEIEISREGFSHRSSITASIEARGLVPDQYIETGNKITLFIPKSIPVDPFIQLSTEHPAWIECISARAPTLEDVYLKRSGTTVNWHGRLTHRSLHELFACLMGGGA